MAFGPRKKKAGWVYVGESTRKDSSKKLYVGQTIRAPSKRFAEHKSSVGKNKTWVGQGTSFTPIGAMWSNDTDADEKKVKQMSPERKRAIGGIYP